ncbi:iron-containing alcohol dehydrogenase [Prosthecodimorpha staleyi]|uniref:Iron-containing alcohol dehydrogenase n=1 Tax=Prosthecodimorpha staleyi TaxID=2840188 RepID=A0A947D7T1_9HYPH|nr:iron-containing alcohol dehydrogenase [Prosthecodimorpha staleyi]MBT9292678.1 iron-containing alcohol dehydrogenase [Prosthecodimorpha staleyi]
MTLIGYLARTHFAEAAIEDALPEEAGALTRALVLIDDEPGAAAALKRVRDALDGMTLTVVAVSASLPSHATAARICAELAQHGGTALMAIGGAAAVGQARLAADHAARQDRRPLVIAVPVSLFDLGLARQIRPADGRPVPCGRPDCIIADPSVLERTPPRRLAAAAMAVLVHAVEAYASPGFNPPADGLALEAVRRMTGWLPTALGVKAGARARAGADGRPAGPREARRELMAAALTAGLAMEKTIGGVDALARPMEAELAGGHWPGEMRAPLLAAVADFNAQAVGERYAALARTFAGSEAEASFNRQIAGFAAAVGMPTRLRDVGIDPGRLDRFAEAAANDPASLANPRRMTATDCRQILEAAW